MAKRSAANRRRPTRNTKRTILIVTNGEKTEPQYLNGLKRHLDVRHATVKVRRISGSPQTLIQKLKSPNGDTSEYDEVWIVVDEDGSDLRGFLSACQDYNEGNNCWVGVASRPCFEVWLIAHYEQVRKYANQRQAQKHFRDLASAADNPKALPKDFPFGQVELAASRCQLRGEKLKGRNELPPSPGSAMPHLVDALRKRR